MTRKTKSLPNSPERLTELHKTNMVGLQGMVSILRTLLSSNSKDTASSHRMGNNSNQDMDSTPPILHSSNSQAMVNNHSMANNRSMVNNNRATDNSLNKATASSLNKATAISLRSKVMDDRSRDTHLNKVDTERLRLPDMAVRCA